MDELSLGFVKLSKFLSLEKLLLEKISLAFVVFKIVSFKLQSKASLAMSYLPPYTMEGQLATAATLRKKFKELIENLHNESKCNASPQSQPLLSARAFYREMEKLRREVLGAINEAAGVNELKVEVKKLVEIMENHATSQSVATQLQSDFQENNLLKWFEEDVNKDFQNMGSLALPVAEPSTSRSINIHSVVLKEDDDCIVIYEGRGTISKHQYLKSRTSASGSQQPLLVNVEQQVENTEAPTGGERMITPAPAPSVDLNDDEREDDGVSSKAPPEIGNGNVAECAGPTSNKLEKTVKWIPGITLRSRTIMVPSRQTWRGRPRGRWSRKRKSI